MARRKTTVYIDETLLRAAKVAAARAGKHEYEIFEEALRRHLGLQEILERVWARTNTEAPSEDEALKLAYQELDAARADRQARRAS